MSQISEAAARVATTAASQGVVLSITSPEFLDGLAAMDKVAASGDVADALRGEEAASETQEQVTEELIDSLDLLDSLYVDTGALLDIIDTEVIPMVAGDTANQSPAAALAAAPTATAEASLGAAEIVAAIDSLFNGEGSTRSSTVSGDDVEGAGTKEREVADKVADAVVSAQEEQQLAPATAVSSAAPTMAPVAPSLAPSAAGGFGVPLSGGYSPAGFAPAGFAAPQAGGFSQPQVGGFSQPQAGGFSRSQAGGFRPTSSPSSGVTAAEVRQMVEDAKRRVAAENAAKRAKSPSSPSTRPSGESHSRPTINRQPVAPAAGAGQPATPPPNPTHGETIKGTAPSPGIQGRVATPGAATSLTGVTQAAGSAASGGSNAGGMRGGMMPMGAMGAMGAAGNQGNHQNTKRAPVTTDDPVLSGKWAVELGTSGGVLGLNGAKFAQVASVDVVAPEKKPQSPGLRLG